MSDETCLTFGHPGHPSPCGDCAQQALIATLRSHLETARKALEVARDALEVMAEPCHGRDGIEFCDWCKLPFDRCNSRYPVCAGAISREAVANLRALDTPAATPEPVDMMAAVKKALAPRSSK